MPIDNVQVSIVTTVRDKNQFKKSIASVFGQKGIDSYEYVVVDWGSKKIDVLKELRSVPCALGNSLKAIRYLRVDADEFNRGRANNVGFRWSMGKYVLTLDCDVVIPPEYLSGLLKLCSKNKWKCLWCLGVESTSSKIRPWCGSGIMFVPLSAIYYIRGYDESFVGYGEEDVDFRSRLERVGYAIDKIQDPLWTHLSHSNKERGQAQLCSRLNGGVNKNRARRKSNDYMSIIRVNGDGWGMDNNAAVKYVEL